MGMGIPIPKGRLFMCRGLGAGGGGVGGAGYIYGKCNSLNVVMNAKKFIKHL